MLSVDHLPGKPDTKPIRQVTSNSIFDRDATDMKIDKFKEMKYEALSKYDGGPKNRSTNPVVRAKEQIYINIGYKKLVTYCTCGYLTVMYRPTFKRCCGYNF